MFNIVTRFQYAANQALSSSIIIAGIVILSSLLQLYYNNAWSLETTSIGNIKPQVLLKHSFNYGSVNRKPKENSRIQFDLETDLSPLFNWNTKQLFVYLTAEYPGKSEGSSNKITYWDKIITSKEDAVLLLKNQKSKYSVWDIEPSFREREAIVKLEWNLQPHIGPLVFGETDNISGFKFAEYVDKRKQQK
ncbi:Microsomal signal peptidase subunit 3 [Debaryomyces fabryi]|uniref:Signal peptidase subunit 3 n=1 Tax=Debaryomyces fabryi TaxID=58627 RepID=A0A0V1Q6K3_9ASCO|nr:Microsomal signal peptidase subunit 3 [Debaryomyces fabryi]KSA04164.1 Microsomal signal peptidase subunit 3 [Debaryomyces fabryi]CUM46220.1 unnamed protein product [Debaryomyces fabryi]